MGKVPFTRLSKKKSGTMAVQDGKFKMEVKERWRFWSAVFTFFTVIFIVVALLIPAIITILAAIYFIMTIIWTRSWRLVKFLTRKIVNGTKYLFNICISLPIQDYRYGRHKRKDFERSKVYGD